MTIAVDWDIKHQFKQTNLYTCDWQILNMLCSGVICNQEKGLAMKKTHYALRRGSHDDCTCTTLYND